MERPGATEKVLPAATAFGAVLVVTAVIVFALTGSGFGADVLRFAGSFVLGMVLVGALTRSPRRGRLVAALVLLLSVGGFLLLILARPDWLLWSVRRDPGWAQFTSGLASSVVGSSLVRLFGFNPLGSRGVQASRRRV